MFKLLAALPLVLTLLFGIRGPHGGPGGGMMQGIIGRLLSPQAIEKLELTVEQVDKLEDLRSSHEKGVLEIRHKIERTQLELNDLMREDEPSESKIKAKISEIGSLRTDLQLAQVDTYFAALKILTPAQIEKIKSLCPAERRGPGCHDRGSGNPGAGGGPAMPPDQMPPNE
jgi:Spy/CpxP family protein refolding chaperone